MTSDDLKLEGHVAIELRVQRRIDIASLTNGFTRLELQEILDEGKEAIACLREEAVYEALRDCDECDVESFELRVDVA